MTQLPATVQLLMEEYQFLESSYIVGNCVGQWGGRRGHCRDPAHSKQRGHHGQEGRQPGNWRKLATALEGCTRVEHREETKPQSKIILTHSDLNVLWFCFLGIVFIVALNVNSMFFSAVNTKSFYTVIPQCSFTFLKPVLCLFCNSWKARGTWVKNIMNNNCCCTCTVTSFVLNVVALELQQ